MKTFLTEKRITTGEKIFYAVNYIIMTLLAFIMLFPIINVIATSFSSSRAIASGEVSLLPVEFTLSAYNSIINDGQIFRSMLNTVIITVIGTALNMISTIMAAYPISKQRLHGRKLFTWIMLFTMLFSGGMIPNFILVKSIGFMDSYLALWVPGLISVYNMIILKSFFENMPISLEEAAQIDGAGVLHILITIVLPLSTPVLATLTLFYAVGHWNNYMNALIYITSSAKQPLMLKLMQMLSNVTEAMQRSGEGAGATEQLMPESIKAASIVVAIFPIMCIYPFLQKYFVKGVMVGSIKG